MSVKSVLLYVHRNRRFITEGREPRTSTSTFTQLLSSEGGGGRGGGRVQSTEVVLRHLLNPGLHGAEIARVAEDAVDKDHAPLGSGRGQGQGQQSHGKSGGHGRPQQALALGEWHAEHDGGHSSLARVPSALCSGRPPVDA